jgi:heterodisulfide reductase subunit A-like polyferredoxin
MAQIRQNFPDQRLRHVHALAKLVEVGRHPNVQILTLASVESLDGSRGIFRSQFGNALAT